MAEESKTEATSIKPSTQFAVQCAILIVDNILDRGLGDSTWRETHRDAYQDLRNYRDDIIAQVTADLQTLRITEVVAMKTERVVATGYTVQRDDGKVYEF